MNSTTDPRYPIGKFEEKPFSQKQKEETVKQVNYRHVKQGRHFLDDLPVE